MAVTLGPGAYGAGHVRPPARSSAVPRRLPSDACLPAPRRRAGRRPRPGPLRLDGCEQEAAARQARPGNRRPAAKKKSSPGLWGVVCGGWNLLARGAGGLARSVARPEEAEPLAPEHRRDGVGLAVLGLAIVLGAAAWSNGIGPVGVGLADGVRWIIGSLVMVLPVVLFFAALRLLRRGPRPEARGRLAIGWLCTIASVLGIAQVVGDPGRPAGRASHGSGGLIGWAVGTPLAAGIGTVVTVVLLGLLAFFGLLVITATPVHQIPERLRELTDRLLGRDDYDDDEYDDEYEDEERGGAAAGPPVPPEVALGGPAHHRPDRPRRARTPPPTRRITTAAGAHRSCAPPVPGRPHDAGRRTCRRSTEPRAADDPAGRGQLRAALAHHPAPRRPAAGPVEGQRRRHRGDHRRPRAVQHRRRRHRVHPRPDGHPLRGRARPRRSRSRRSPR